MQRRDRSQAGLIKTLGRRAGRGGGQDQVAKVLDQLARETAVSADWDQDLERVCSLEEDLAARG